jgi:hypothetical protein
MFWWFKEGNDEVFSITIDKNFEKFDDKEKWKLTNRFGL